MSQVYKSLTSGPVPPAVPTTFTTDSGSAIPALNILNVLANDTIANDTDGLTTQGAGNTVTVLLTNRVSIDSITSDGAGQTQNIVIMTPTTATSITFRVLVSGYDAINNVAIGGEQIGLVRTLGGVVTVVGTNDTFDESDAVLGAADWNIISSSPTLSMQFVGLAGRVINWRALFEYTQAP